MEGAAILSGVVTEEVTSVFFSLFPTLPSEEEVKKVGCEGAKHALHLTTSHWHVWCNLLGVGEGMEKHWD